MSHSPFFCFVWLLDKLALFVYFIYSMPMQRHYHVSSAPMPYVTFWLMLDDILLIITAVCFLVLKKKMCMFQDCMNIVCMWFFYVHFNLIGSYTVERLLKPFSLHR